ncbi:holo-ACP synthase [bacterium]|jgi:holo-[acyl-carrier protein] synthase|nr:holo-ACP synthase [bacterium]MBT5015107.1 holo-ACP synthase [bacterium]
MRIKVGCDLVYVPRFKEKIIGAEFILEKVFTPYEVARSYSQESLAGRFALKEAVMKALGIPAGKWLEIEVVNDTKGKPYCKFLSQEIQLSILGQDVSISHDGEYAMAMSVFILKPE